MRESLIHTIGDKRHTRRRRAAGQPSQVAVEPAPDPAVQRVREAGGPIDMACYTCHCGYLFVAHVSTTVTCAHCGSQQAW